MTRALIVGAGSIGQVFGRHLQQGGTEVWVLDRPHRAEAARAGFPMYPLNRLFPRRAPVRFVPDHVLDDPAAVGEQPFDLVFLTVPSFVIQGGLLDEVGPHLGDAVVCLITAALGDRERVLAHVPEEHVAQAFIGLMSYPAPLPGEEVPEPGMAYWFPPLSKSGVAGPPAARRAVVEALTAGGLPAAELDAPTTSGLSAAVLMPHLLGLELCGWSLADLRSGPMLARAGEATDEARAIVAALEGEDVHPLPPFLMWAVLYAAPAVFPYPLEAYLKRHFTKVGEQTLLNARAWIREGHRLGLPTAALEELTSRVASARGADSPS